LEQSEYEALCRQAEAQAETNPSRYKRKLYAFSFLGHAVLFGVLFLLIALVVGIGILGFFWSGLFILLAKKKVLFLVLPVIWVIARALWVKFDKPEGYELMGCSVVGITR